MTDYLTEKFANDAQTTLDGTMDDSQGTLNVVDATAFPAEGQFRIRVEDEYMLVTGVNLEEFSVLRAAEGSVAAAHADTSTVTHVLTAGGLDERTTDLPQPLRIIDHDGYAFIEVLESDDTPDQRYRQVSLFMSSASPGGPYVEAFRYFQDSVDNDSEQSFRIKRSDGSNAIEYQVETGFVDFTDADDDSAVLIDPFGHKLSVFGPFSVPFADFDAPNQLFSLNGWMDLQEQPSAPAAPDADTARLYSEDLGGKTALYVRFATGTPVKIAEEP